MLPYIKVGTYLFVYNQFIFSVYKEIARLFMLFSFAFLYLRLLNLDYFYIFRFFYL